jgi:DNA-binding CsgD family transcriptional regulator
VKPLDLKMFVMNIRKILKNSVFCNLRNISLTRMERLVLNLIISDKNNKEMVVLMKTSRKFIKNHCFSLMKKINVHNITALSDFSSFYYIFNLENELIELKSEAFNNGI